MTETNQDPSPASSQTGASEVDARPQGASAPSQSPTDQGSSGASQVEATPRPKRAMSEEQRLEEGLEETFPASDPVSAKHID